MNDQTGQNGQKPKSSCLLKAIILMGIVIMLLYLFSPSFLRFAARNPESEAKQNLGAIFTAYTAYYSDHNTYPSAPFINIKGETSNCLSVANWEPKGTIRYNYKCMETIAFSPEYNRYPGCTGCPKEKIYIHADQTSFTIAACANIDSNEFCDEWTIDDSKLLRHISDGYTNNTKYQTKKILKDHFIFYKNIEKLIDDFFDNYKAR